VAGVCAHHAEAVLEAGAEIEPVYAAGETAVTELSLARDAAVENIHCYSPDC